MKIVFEMDSQYECTNVFFSGKDAADHACREYKHFTSVLRYNTKQKDFKDCKKINGKIYYFSHPFEE